MDSGNAQGLRTLVLLQCAIAVLTTVCLVGSSMAADASAPFTAQRGRARALCLAKPPAVDGTLDGPAWQKAPLLELGQVTGRAASPLKTAARIIFDERNVYVAVQCEDSDTAHLKAVKARPGGAAGKDDSVSIFLCPDPDRGFRQITVNSNGTVRDEACRLDGTRIAAWNSHARAKVSVQNGKGWTVVLAAPLANLRLPGSEPDLGGQYRPLSCGPR